MKGEGKKVTFSAVISLNSCVIMWELYGQEEQIAIISLAGSEQSEADPF